MSAVTTHILDTALGKPAAGVSVSLAMMGSNDAWIGLAQAATDTDGRIREFLSPGQTLRAGTYRLRFDTGPYHAARGVAGGGFFPFVDVVFEIKAAGQHFHVPLLLSPFGYSTYRGS
ncbi:MAG: hydroxyisourate hydrolase [Phycisphaerales bacterium]|nr:hydroxyisourate hydrolase [Phycisphaerales bacterium]